MSKRKVSVENRINKPITNTISQFISQASMKKEETYNGIKNDKENIANNITLNDNKIDTNINTEEETKNSTIIDKERETDIQTNDDKKNEINFVTKNETLITHTKRVQIGNDVFKSVYSNGQDVKRAAYHLRQDTIDKIERCSKLSGLKKAEFVDLVLNNILTDILNKIDK